MEYNAKKTNQQHEFEYNAIKTNQEQAQFVFEGIISKVGKNTSMSMHQHLQWTSIIRASVSVFLATCTLDSKLLVKAVMTNFSDVSNILPYYASRTRDLKVLVTTLTLMIRGLKTAQKNVWPGCCSDSVARLCCSFAAIGDRHNDTSEVEGHHSFLLSTIIFVPRWNIVSGSATRCFFALAITASKLHDLPEINTLHLFVIQALQATKDRSSLTFMLGDIIFSDFQEKDDMGRFLSQEQLRKWQL